MPCGGAGHLASWWSIATLSAGVFLIVLLAALLHASWNALVKASPDKAFDLALVTTSAAAISAVMLPFLDPPASASWSCIATSAIIHVAYFLLIGAAYRHGEMSQAYPLMRGAAPLLVALASWPLLGETLSPASWGGILLICGGILTLLIAPYRAGAPRRLGRGTRFALLNAVVIAAYTLVDGTGARASGHAVAYTMWVFLLTAPALAWRASARSRAAFAGRLRARWRFGLVGGACTLAAYVLVLWAMTRAPVAMVAALRETAILFGAVLSALVLKERVGWRRPVAAGIILAGVVAMRLA